MELPRNVGELLDAYHASSAGEDPEQLAWVEIVFAIAETMDQARVRFIVHEGSGVVFERRYHELIPHRIWEASSLNLARHSSELWEASALRLARYSAESLAALYARLRSEHDVWLLYDRCEATRDPCQPLRVVIHDAAGQEQSWCPESQDLVWNLVRVRRADPISESTTPVPERSIGVTPLVRQGDPGVEIPVYLVDADRLMPSPEPFQPRL